ncbi:MAG TPA: histidine kinase [Streptosporangiaceae bacterium]|nr:histidine kinase [Streptosporangiaceae bacterium]
MSTGQTPDHPGNRDTSEASIAWPEVWAWAGERLAVAGRGLLLFGLALAGLIQLALLAGALVGSVVLTVRVATTGHRVGALVIGACSLVSWLVSPFILRWMRSLARLTRRVVAQWAQVPIADPYLPRPWATGGSKGPRRRLAWLLTDPATWRDLLWVTVNGLVGWILALLPAAALVLGLVGIVAPYASGLNRVLIIGGAIAVTWTSPNLLRGYGYFARSMLAPTREAELTLRVQQLAQTRTDAIDTGAAEIRRIERDLHDGAQARLVAMGMTLDAAGQIIDSNPDAARALLYEARDASVKALAELRDLVRGIHPPVLADRGVADAIRALSLDTPLRIHLASELHGRPPAPIESAAYFAVSELLANVTKHAEARQTWIDLRYTDGMLRIGVTDNGHGGADPAHGTGLRGIERRLAPFDGVLAVSSPPGGPTAVTMEIPCELSLPKTSSC